MKILLLLTLSMLFSCDSSIGTSGGSKLANSADAPAVVPSAFSPTDISGIEVWLDASDETSRFQQSDCTISATSALDKVGCLRDKSGNNNHATASGADRPSYLGDSIQFIGDANPSNNGTCFDLSTFAGQTVFIVLDNITTSVDGFHGLLGHSTNDDYLFLSTNKGYAVSFDGSGADHGRFSINDSALSAFGENVGSNLDSSLKLMQLEFEDAHSGWVNIGCFNHGSGAKTYRSNFDLNEIIIYSGTPSDAEALVIKNYLNAKWSVY